MVAACPRGFSGQRTDLNTSSPLKHLHTAISRTHREHRTARSRHPHQPLDEQELAGHRTKWEAVELAWWCNRG
jgi:hypothetical protein